MCKPPLSIGLIAMLFLAPHDAHGKSPPHHDHGHKGHAHGGRHGNPEDLDGYIARMEDPSRDEWQKPDEVIKALEVQPGQTVCDIGAGPGYFALRFGKAVGERGGVFGVDVEPPMLDVLRARIARSGARNVTPVLGLPDDPLLPPASCDLILIVNTFHHLPDGAAYLRRLTRSLRPGGRVVNIDFQKKETPMGPPVEHRVSREAFVAAAGKAGLDVVAEPALLPYQYFVVMKAR